MKALFNECLISIIILLIIFSPNALFSKSETSENTIVLSPIADAFTRGGAYANTNYGTLPTLTLKTALADWSRNAYLKFDLSTVSSVNTAKLRLYASSLQDQVNPVNIAVYGSGSDSWTEKGITWNNAPAANGDAPAILPIGPGPQYYEFDVTHIVQGQVNGDKVVTFVVKEPAHKNLLIDFHSKENTSLHPELVIGQTSGTTAPAAPANFSASVSGPSSINLKWATVTGASSYEITYVTGTSTTYNPIQAALGGSATSYSHTGLQAGTTYNYRIKALNSSGSSGFSNASASIPASPPTAGAFPVVKNSVWKYHDQGVDLGTSWTSKNFDDFSWKSGPAVLGYGDPVSTSISFGSSSTNKHITYYFRHAFEVSDASIYQNLVFNIRRDDGAVVYLNGVEQFRTNMPTGPITYKTTAQTTVSASDESSYFTFKVPASQLENGYNVIAVSVHQDKVTSSDLTFDMEVTGELKNTNPDNCMAENSDKIGCFTSIKPAAQSELFVYPDSHVFQQLAKTGVTKYTTGGTGSMPAGNDFTAFISKNGSNKEGYLSINHENNPGGVSVLNIKLNEQNLLWEVNGVHKMDFSKVVRTSRNCSGGITPWGTIITSEETYETGDSNGDGYHDVGWNVEFDPVSGNIVDYNGDGVPDKLWAMGRMKHENVAFANDNVTVYQGEDGGSSCVYKYVAKNSGDLSDGALYVLKRNSSNLTLGEWVMVPNSTKSDRNNTSSIAGSLGGTNWNEVEDIEVGPDGKIYFSSKAKGTIWRFKDNGSNVSEIEAWVTNTQYPITYDSGTQMENFGLGIDNLVFDGEGNLWALQDGGRNHLWVIKHGHTPSNPKVELFATMPIGAEPTGLTFSPDFKYGFFSLQHPNALNEQIHSDASGAEIKYNAPVTVVFARKEHLGSFSTMFATNSKFSKISQVDSSFSPASLESGLQVKVFPNPFESGFTALLSLSEKSHITAELLSTEGIEIRSLFNDILDKGNHSLEINNLGNLQNGVYLIRVRNQDQTVIKRIIHLKN